jgi:hypothetical protein
MTPAEDNKQLMFYAQSLAYNEGQRDREQSKPMRESWTMEPAVQNAYRSGYVDACCTALFGTGDHLADA